ncbi:MAG: glycerophosphodiester phosphodiesterase [Rhizobiales bacterium]|nr:glycerophosphodiester phosphodiesterase [Hyphomicrobiales bacterium]
MARLVATAIAAIITIATSAAGAFDLQGHRGARGLAPENTLEGFARALSIGVSTLELDLGMSKDGVVVVHHDIRLNPDTTRGPDGAFLKQRGPALRALTLAELQRYDVGRLKPGTSYAASFPEQRPIDRARIPTLAAVFDLVRNAKADHVRFNIETKMTPKAAADVADPETFAAAVTKVTRDAGLVARVSVQSFDWRTLAAFRRLASDIPRICLTVERGANDNIQRGRPGPSPWTAGLDVDDFGGSTPRLVKAADCASWSPLFIDLNQDALNEAKALGLAVIPWTVNERGDMDRLIADGVDGLITDYPDRLRDVMVAKKLPLPPTVTPP